MGSHHGGRCYGSRRFILAVCVALNTGSTEAVPRFDGALQRKYLLVGVGAADGKWEREWIEAHLAHSIQFRPLLVEADVGRIPALTKLAEAHGGRVVQGVASVRGGQRVPLQGAGTTCGTVIPSPFCTPNASQTRWLDTVHLAPLVSAALEESGEDVHAVMHMDVEGAEYELLRDLIVRGLACRFQQIYVETHAMFFPALHHLRPVDVVLPWLLGSDVCNVEVFVDNHYHLERHIWRQPDAQWPEADGACDSCPLLYRPLPPHLEGAPACPTTGVHFCWEPGYTCERCCDIRKGLRGDEECWKRKMPWGPMAHLNSYEFCCAMVTPMAWVYHPQMTSINSVSFEASNKWRENARLLPPAGR